MRMPNCELTRFSPRSSLYFENFRRFMRPLIQEIATAHTPESLVENLRSERGVVLLRTSQFDSPSARYSFVTANPFLTFRSFGSRCEISEATPQCAARPP